MDEASSAYRPGGAAPGSVRVVVADDSAGMRALLRAQLGTVARRPDRRGGALDGAEAVEQAVREIPDLVLLDVAMPTIDGLEATAEIRRRLPTAKIVVFSGYSGEKMAESARAAGGGCVRGKGRPHR